LKTLLQLQDLDLEIEAYRKRETEIPKQKTKLNIRRERLAAELAERQKACQDLKLEQRKNEGDIEEMQKQAGKYEQQLLLVKKNEEYQALLHEIDLLKKQVGLKEERIITIMMQLDQMIERLEEDRKRIEAEERALDEQCAAVDAELAEARAKRMDLEQRRAPARQAVDPGLLRLYDRVRRRRPTGRVVVPLNDEVCSGCNMTIPAQICNEVLAGERLHACVHCGRVLYSRGNVA